MLTSQIMIHIDDMSIPTLWKRSLLKRTTSRVAVVITTALIAQLSAVLLMWPNNAQAQSKARTLVESSSSNLPNHFQVVFEVSSSGSVVGELSMAMRRQGKDYTLRSEATPKGLAVLLGSGKFSQESLFGVKSRRVLPFSYNEQRKKRGRPPEWNLEFDWDDMLITMPDGRRIPIPQQPVDPAAVSVQVMLTPPSHDRDLVVHLVDDQGVRKHTFSLIGEEAVETPMGKVNAYHLRQRKQGAKKNRFVDIWIAPDNWNLPIRMQRHRKGRIVTFALKSLDAG